jgi:hypothetical protein
MKQGVLATPNELTYATPPAAEVYQSVIRERGSEEGAGSN